MCGVGVCCAALIGGRRDQLHRGRRRYRTNRVKTFVYAAARLSIWAEGGMPANSRKAVGSRQVMVVPRPAAEFDRDGSAMQIDQALDQRQAEPGTRSRRAAFELFEHPGLIGRRNADPAIGNGQQQLALAAFGLDAYRAARRGELDRIGNQVEKRLLEPAFVRRNRADVRRTTAARSRALGFWRAPASAPAPFSASRKSRPGRSPEPCNPPRSWRGRGYR